MYHPPLLKNVGLYEYERHNREDGKKCTGLRLGLSFIPSLSSNI